MPGAAAIPNEIRRRDLLWPFATAAISPLTLAAASEDWIDVSPGAELSGWTEYPWFEEKPALPSGQWRLDTGRNVLICSGLDFGRRER